MKESRLCKIFATTTAGRKLNVVPVLVEWATVSVPALALPIGVAALPLLVAPLVATHRKQRVSTALRSKSSFRLRGFQQYRHCLCCVFVLDFTTTTVIEKTTHRGRSPRAGSIPGRPRF